MKIAFILNQSTKQIFAKQHTNWNSNTALPKGTSRQALREALTLLQNQISPIFSESHTEGSMNTRVCMWLQGPEGRTGARKPSNPEEPADPRKQGRVSWEHCPAPSVGRLCPPYLQPPPHLSGVSWTTGWQQTSVGSLGDSGNEGWKLILKLIWGLFLYGSTINSIFWDLCGLRGRGLKRSQPGSYKEGKLTTNQVQRISTLDAPWKVSGSQGDRCFLSDAVSNRV